jgi:hypothetical protein
VAELVGADVRVLSSISPQRGVHPAHLPHARAPTRPGKEAQPTNKLWGLPRTTYQRVRGGTKLTAASMGATAPGAPGAPSTARFAICCPA